MKNIYVIVEFELNSPDLMDDWKKVSASITEDMTWAPGFMFRDSAVDDKDGVYCILKWESEDHEVEFGKKMDKMFKEQPEIMKEFGRIVDMDTMSMKKLRVL